jgi:rRNA-processing protein FCF1
MTDVEYDVDSLLAQYRTAGVLVDTNILLLYFVRAYDQGLIERWSRTADRFVSVDFDTLLVLLEPVERLAVTPHVLTEVNNLLDGLYGYAKTECFRLLAQAIDSVMNEKRTPSDELAKDPAFLRFGIADTSILDAAAGSYLVLTEDLPLYAYLQGQGVDVLNFNQLRELAY